MLFRLFLLIAFFALAGGPAVRAKPEDPALLRFLGKYRCPLAQRIQSLHERGNPAVEMNRYFVVSLPSGAYAQCHFYDRDTGVYCEAYSGFYHTEGSGKRRYLPTAAVQALVNLGFDPDDSRGNFHIEFRAGSPPNPYQIATLVLKVLHDAFGAEETTNLFVDDILLLVPPTCDALS